MAYKNKVSVRVCGRNMTLAGNESVEYMTKVANYIEQKASELRNSPASKNLSPQMISVLTSINIADDYYKQLDINTKLKALLPEDFDVSKAEKGMLFTQDKLDEFKIEIERLRKEMAELKKANGVLEEKLAIAENKAVLMEEDNKRKTAEIARLKEYEALFEGESGENAESTEEAEVKSNTEEETKEEDSEVFENQMEIAFDENSDASSTEETEFPLHDEGEKADKKNGNANVHKHGKAHSGNKNYYRQI